MKKKRWLWLLIVVIGLGVITPSYVRAYRVGGASDAPSFLVGDRILVNKAAYDLRVPYTDIVVFSLTEPQRGDVVVFRPPGSEATVFKRVVGCPGDTLVMLDSHLEINDVALQYERVDAGEYRPVAMQNNLGQTIESEKGMGRPHLIIHTPGAGSHASFGPVGVPPGHYFLMGDNRDSSLDSRMYGPAERRSILGKVVYGHPAVP